MKAILAAGALLLAAVAGPATAGGAYYGGYYGGHYGRHGGSYGAYYGGHYGGHRRYGGGDLAGALIVGAVLGHVLTRPSYSYAERVPGYRPYYRTSYVRPYYSRPHYSGSYYARSYAPRSYASYGTYRPGSYDRRYVLDQGVCYLVNSESGGREVWTRVPGDNCY